MLPSDRLETFERCGGVLRESCAAHQLHADVEVIPIQDINKAYERMIHSDVRYRFVIDMKSLARA
jgi:uncharacterized zinc-type alcohol dehydrogenase-like protein